MRKRARATLGGSTITGSACHVYSWYCRFHHTDSFRETERHCTIFSAQPRKGRSTQAASVGPLSAVDALGGRYSSGFAPQTYTIIHSFPWQPSFTLGYAVQCLHLHHCEPGGTSLLNNETSDADMIAIIVGTRTTYGTLWKEDRDE